MAIVTLLQTVRTWTCLWRRLYDICDCDSAGLRSRPSRSPSKLQRRSAVNMLHGFARYGLVFCAASHDSSIRVTPSALFGAYSTF